MLLIIKADYTTQSSRNKFVISLHLSGDEKRPRMQLIIKKKRDSLAIQVTILLRKRGHIVDSKGERLPMQRGGSINILYATTRTRSHDW